MYDSNNVEALRPPQQNIITMPKPVDIVKHYKTLSEFVAYLDNNPTLPAYKSRDHSKYSDWAKCQNLLRSGDVESMKEVQKVSGYVNPNCLPQTEIEHFKRVNKVCGGSVRVGAYLTGAAKCFRGRKREMVQCKFVTINLLITDQCMMSQSEKKEGSCKLLGAIRILEANNIRCTVNVLDNGIDSGYYQENGQKRYFTQKYVFSVCVKAAEAPLNELSLAYPLINQNMMYRQAFRWAEVTPGLRFSGGYGGVMSLESTRELAQLPGAWFNTQRLAGDILSIPELAKLIAAEAK